jgi:hypothetical protein
MVTFANVFAKNHELKQQITTFVPQSLISSPLQTN